MKEPLLFSIDGGEEETLAGGLGVPRAPSSSLPSTVQGKAPPPDDEDPVVHVEGYAPSILGTLCWVLLHLITAGLVFLVGHWRKDWRLRVMCRKAPLAECTYVIVTRRSGGKGVEKVLGRRDVLASPEDAPPSRDTEPLIQGAASARTAAKLARAPQPERRFFTHRYLRYIYYPESRNFALPLGIESGYTIGGIHTLARNGPATIGPRADRAIDFGPNTISVEMRSYSRLLVEEVLSPFYIFQIFAVILWCTEKYYYFAACVFVVSLFSVIITLRETRRNLESLHSMVAFKDTLDILQTPLMAPVEILKRADAETLLPGDIFVVTSGMVVSCDAVILSGECIVNESMLTGESVPVTKSSLPADTTHATEAFLVNSQRSHVIFRGTNVLQTRSKFVRAMAVKTGFTTAKGELVRAILFPKESKFRFYEDGLKFLAFMAFLALIGLIYSCVALARYDISPGIVIQRALDLITTIVPPALPAAMSIGTIYAINRLKKQRIFCISPPRVNVAGKLKIFCFDKTGTLTEDGLNLWGIQTPSGTGFHDPVTSIKSQQSDDPFVMALACCHSLAKLEPQHGPESTSVQIEETPAGSEVSLPRIAEPVADTMRNIIGDPMELQLFQTTGWVLHEPKDESDAGTREAGAQLFERRRSESHVPAPARPYTYVSSPRDSKRVGIALLKQYIFSSRRQRMAIIAGIVDVDRSAESDAWIFVKGAPERIHELSLAETVPENFSQLLFKYTQQGYRVLAVAGKKLTGLSWAEARSAKRDEVEKDLTFMGLVVFQNKLKPTTTGVIEELNRAAIRSVMITGDNVLTACSVARECGIVPSNDQVLLAAAVADSKHGYRLVLQPEERATIFDKSPSNKLLACGSRFVKFPTLVNDVPQSSWLPPKNHLEGTKGVSIAIMGSEFAVLREHLPEDYKRLIVGGSVFARMTPEQKTQLVEDLIDLGYCVGMCGDGANDCGALKAAHVGISLSEAEASVAAPFTSAVPDIRCVPSVIREGRAALVTSFVCFKFMALYSFIQFTSVMILYWINSNLGDFQYLYIDLFVILSIAVVMGRSGSQPILSQSRPQGSLISIGIIASLLVQLAVEIAFQTAIFEFTKRQTWFEPLIPDPKIKNILCYENTSVFLCSIFMYLSVAIAFSVGKPFRGPLWRNFAMIGVLVLLFAVNLQAAFKPFDWVESVLQLRMPPPTFRWAIFGFAAAHFVVTFAFERVIVNNEYVRRALRPLRRKKAYKNKYKNIVREMFTSNWPMQAIENYSESATPST